MALPVLPLIGIAASVIGTGIGAIGAIQSSRAQAAAANYQSQVAANNAQIAQQNAALAAQTGQAKAEATGLRNREAIAAATAAIAANGVDVNTGSALDVRTTQRQIG